jgi:hypothetical protein
MEGTVVRRAMVAVVVAIAAARPPVQVIHLAEVVAMPAAADTSRS